MGKFSKESYVCLVSGIWAVVVVLCSLLDLLDMSLHDGLYDIICKLLIAVLGVVQFMLSAKLMGINKYQDNGNAAPWSARSYYYGYLIIAILITTIFIFYYIFKERSYYRTTWGFSYYDMILYFDIGIFVAFAIFHTPPPILSRNNGISYKPNGRMNVDWIAREAVPVEQISIPGFGINEKTGIPVSMKLHSAENTNIPYSQMENDSFA